MRGRRGKTTWRGAALAAFFIAGALIAPCGGCAAWRDTADGDAAGERGRKVSVDEPGTLRESDTEYILEKDIVAKGTAFVIEASRVTLNLNGHRIVYGTGEERRNVFGVSVPGHRLQDIRIVNGTIVQREGGSCRGDEQARGCSPIHMPADVEGAEIANLEISWDAPNTGGIYLHWGKDAHIHHNRFRDGGSVVSNRHQGVAVVENTRGRGLSAHHNEIVRSRHVGIRTGEGAEIFENTVGIDSVATNATGLAAAGGKIYRNRVEGKGVHPVGIWPGSDIRVFENFVRVQNTRPGEEYGSTGAACLRMTWGNDGVEVTDNIFILEASEAEEKGGMTSWGRALWVGLPHEGEKALFERNLIVANNRRGKAKAAAIAVVCNNASSGLVFRDNTVISNWGNVLLADDYGHADGFPRFVRNTFVRQDDFPGYSTIRSEYPERPSTGVFIDNRFLNGAGMEKVDLPYAAGGKKELRFGRTMEIEVTDGKGRGIPGAEVRIVARGGETVFKGKTAAEGKATAELIEYRLRPKAGGTPEGRLFREEEGPFTVTALKGSMRSIRTVPAGDTGKVRLPLATGGDGE